MSARGGIKEYFGLTGTDSTEVGDQIPLWFGVPKRVQNMWALIWLAVAVGAFVFARLLDYDVYESLFVAALVSGIGGMATERYLLRFTR